MFGLQRPARSVAASVTILALGVLAACGGGGGGVDGSAAGGPSSAATTAAPASTTTAPVDTTTPTSGTDTTAGSEELSEEEARDRFCDLGAQLSVPVERSHIGSEAHVASLEALLEVAPDDIVDDVTLLRDHFRDAVDPAVPSSQDTENFPAPVRAASTAVSQAIAAC